MQNAESFSTSICTRQLQSSKTEFKVEKEFGELIERSTTGCTLTRVKLFMHANRPTGSKPTKNEMNRKKINKYDPKYQQKKPHYLF